MSSPATPAVSPTPAALRAAAEAACRTVAPQLLQAFRSDMAITTKRDAHDVVTVHDRAAEETITTALTRAFPGLGGARGGGRQHR